MSQSLLLLIALPCILVLLNIVTSVAIFFNFKISYVVCLLLRVAFLSFVAVGLKLESIRFTRRPFKAMACWAPLQGKSADLGRRVCLVNNLEGDADAVGLGTALWEPLITLMLHSWDSFIFPSYIIPLCEYTSVFISILLVMGIWVASNSWVKGSFVWVFCQILSFYWMK